MFYAGKIRIGSQDIFVGQIPIIQAFCPCVACITEID